LAQYEPALARHRPDAALISAARGWGLDELRERIDHALGRLLQESAPRASQRDAWAASASS
jgi:50S ribosomal subunit-associated GTPase HflX